MPARKANRIATALMAAALLSLTLAAGAARAGSPPEVDREKLRQDRLETLAKELVETANKYGPDAVALQIALLTKTIEAGAVESTSVRVVGPSERDGQRFLRIDVATGLLFDEEKTSAGERFERVWSAIARPALTGLERFDFRPSGLDLGFAYRTQIAARLPGGRLDADAPGIARETRALLDAASLAELAAGTLAAELLIGRASVERERLLTPPSEPAGAEP